jgi:RNA ligase (TIGR02306 family)
MAERKMATIRTIAEIKKIEGADRIQAYRVDGWWVIDQVDKYEVGDLVIYCEIDSWIPNELAPFLSKGKEPREFNGIKGERLKTIKLKGQLSQGLLLPLNVYYTDRPYESIEADEGDDVSELLGITKWELPEKEFIRLYGENKEARSGGFPAYIPKSDQERIQNIPEKRLASWIEDEVLWEVTEKLEGSSLTVYHCKEEEDEGVCSRNINLKKPEDPASNKFWLVVERDNILEKLKSLDRSLAFQGELVGPGVCGNIYGLDKYDFYLYNIWDITYQKWLLPDERRDIASLLNIKQVPLVSYGSTLDKNEYCASLLEKATGTSVISKILREGLVYKALDRMESFKAVSNEYLMEK